MLVVGHVVLALVAQVAGDAATPAIAPSEAKSIAVCDLYHILASFGQPAPQVDVDHDGVIGTADLLASLATLAGDSSRPHPPSSHFERESAEDVAASPFHRPPDRGVCHSVAWAFSAWFAAVSFAAGFAAGSVCCPVFCALMMLSIIKGSDRHHQSAKTAFWRRGRSPRLRLRYSQRRRRQRQYSRWRRRQQQLQERLERDRARVSTQCAWISNQYNRVHAAQREIDNVDLSFSTECWAMFSVVSMVFYYRQYAQGRRRQRWFESIVERRLDRLGFSMCCTTTT